MTGAGAKAKDKTGVRPGSPRVFAIDSVVPMIISPKEPPPAALVATAKVQHNHHHRLAATSTSDLLDGVVEETRKATVSASASAAAAQSGGRSSPLSVIRSVTLTTTSALANKKSSAESRPVSSLSGQLSRPEFSPRRRSLLPERHHHCHRHSHSFIPPINLNPNSSTEEGGLVHHPGWLYQHGNDADEDAPSFRAMVEVTSGGGGGVGGRLRGGGGGFKSVNSHQKSSGFRPQSARSTAISRRPATPLVNSHLINSRAGAGFSRRWRRRRRRRRWESGGVGGWEAGIVSREATRGANVLLIIERQRRPAAPGTRSRAEA